MGPLLFAGLTTFGATVAIGIVAAGVPRPTLSTASVPASRRMAVILFGIATGGGLWGVVVAFLAAASGGRGTASPAPDVAGAPLVAVLPILGAVAALVLLMGAFSRLDAWILGRAAVFIASLVVLAIVAAILTVVLHGPAVALTAAPFVLLGLLSAAAAIGLGLTGVGAVASVVELDDAPRSDREIGGAMDRALRRCVPFIVVQFGAAALAVLLVSSRL